MNRSLSFLLGVSSTPRTALALALLVGCGADEAAPATDTTPPENGGKSGASGRSGGSAGKAGTGSAGAAAGSAGAVVGGSPAAAGKGGAAVGGSGGDSQSAGGSSASAGGSGTSAGGSSSAGGNGAGGSSGAGAGGSGSGAAGGMPGQAGSPGVAGQSGSPGAAGQGGKPATGPTCAKAGGDRCGATKDACSGLTSFASSDCVSCCKVPDNPVIDTGFADPFIVRAGDTYYAFATGGTVRRRESKNLINWGPGTNAIEKSPWKSPKAGFWAPTVYKAKSGKWILYYAAETDNPNDAQHCIGKAVANAPDGDFVDKMAKPFICASSYWSIDPSVFQDADGKDYLLWRQDTAAQSKGNVAIQQLDANGDLVGARHELISRAKAEPSWEFDAQGGVLENPAMVKHGGKYHLFYSANRWETAKYANGHAVCDTPTGGCKKTSTTEPWQGSKGKMKGPGGADVVEAKDGTLFMYMHGWEDPKIGADAGGERKLWLWRLEWNGAAPVIKPL